MIPGFKEVLIALLRILWPFANSRTREVVGTAVGILAAVVAALAWVIPEDTLPPPPDVPVPAVDAPDPAPVPEIVPTEDVAPAADPEAESAVLAVLRHATGLLLPVGCSGAQRAAWTAFGQVTADCLLSECRAAEGLVSAFRSRGWADFGLDMFPCAMKCLGKGGVVGVQVAQVESRQRTAWFGTSDEVRVEQVYRITIPRAM